MVLASDRGNPGCETEVTILSNACLEFIAYVAPTEESKTKDPPRVLVRWDTEVLIDKVIPQVGSASTFELSVTIPPEATPGTHDITVECPNEVYGPFHFLVIGLAFSLDPVEGRPGDVVTFAGSGLECFDPVTVVWNDDTELGPVELSEPYAPYELTFAVPSQPVPPPEEDMPVEVSVRCDGDVVVRVDFTMLGPPRPLVQVGGEPVRPGSALSLTTSGIACASAEDTLVALFDSAELEPASDVPAVSPYQNYRVDLTVPTDATAGVHTVNVRCAGQPEAPAAPVEVEVEAEAAQAHIAVDPARGWPGRPVTISVVGVDCSTFAPAVLQARLDGTTDLGRSQEPANDPAQTYTITTEIPASAQESEHTVQVWCAGAPTSDPLLTVDLLVDVPAISIAPRTAQAGDLVTVTASGFDCWADGGRGALMIRIDDLQIGRYDSVVAGQNVDVAAQIPVEAAPGIRQVSAHCDGSPRQSAQTRLGVAGLVVAPTEAVVGTSIMVRGEGALCRTLEYDWDDPALDPPRQTINARSGAFESSFEVPDGSWHGRHTVSVFCDNLTLAAEVMVYLPTVEVSPREATPGGQLRVSGAHYSAACRSFQVSLDGNVVGHGDPVASAPGGKGVDIDITVPAQAAPGTAQVDLQCLDDPADPGSVIQARPATFVIPSEPGTPSWIWPLIGALALASGAVASRTFRRRSDRRKGPVGPAVVTVQLRPAQLSGDPSGEWTVTTRSGIRAVGRMRRRGGADRPGRRDGS